MQTDLPIRCSCGRLRAVIRGLSPGRANRVVCCCSSCQEYARVLDRADEILDPHGGTEVFQTSPARLHITDGEDQLACVQLTPTGALRWYADCCNTPLANTLPSRGVPFMAVHHLCVDRSALDRPVEDFIGPIRVTVNGRFSAEQARRLNATRWALVKMLLRYAPMILWWRLRGDHKRSPLFDRQTGAPVRAVRSPDLREKLAAGRPALKPKRAGCG